MSAPLAAIADALERRLAGGLIQDVRAAGPGLLAVSVRLPGESVHLGLSILDGATGVALLGGVRARTAEGALDGLRDRARAVLAGGRVTAVLHGDSPPRLAIMLAGDDAITALVLRDETHGGNLAVIAGGAAHALRARRPEDSHPVQWVGGLARGVEAPDFDLAAASAELLDRRRAVIARQGLAELARRVRLARAAAQRLALKRGDDVERQRDPAEARARADALAAVLHRVRAGDASVEAEHPADGRPIVVSLDPALNPGQNLDRAYATAARAERGLGRARAMLAEALASLDRLEDLESRVRTAIEEGSSPESFDTLQSEAAPLVPARARGTEPERAPATKSWPAGVAAHVSLDGHVILVGRTAQANDVITFRLARGNNPWLHARDAPGPHVVLMLPKGAEVPQESLLDAATLAHAFSQRGEDLRGEVTWCRAKDVRKPKGAPPGKVTLARERTLSLRIEPERLARLRASRR